MKLDKVFKDDRIQNIIFAYIVAVLGVFAGTSDLINILIPSYHIQLFFAGIACVLAFIMIAMRTKDVSEHKLLLISLIIMICPWYRTNWTVLQILVFMLAVMLVDLCIMYQKIRKYLVIMLFILLIADIFYALMTIACRMNRTFYMDYVVKLFPRREKRLVGWYNQNCMAGITSHYSTNGMFLATGLLIMVSLYMEKREKKIWMGIVLFIITLLLTGKRGHIIYPGVAILLMYMLYNKKSAKTKIRNIFLVGATGMIILVLFYLFFPPLGMFVGRFIETIQNGDVLNGRGRLWILAINSFKNHPLGIGWKEFKPLVSPAFSVGTMEYDVHNIYLQLLCETGIWGFVCYIVWFVMMYITTIREYLDLKRRNMDYNKGILTMMSFSLLFQTFFLIYGFSGNPLYEKQTFIPYFLSCAITVHSVLYGKKAKIDRSY